MFLPPAGVILGATSVYKCDKGLFARGFCVFEVCTQVCTVCTKCVGSPSSFVKSVTEDRKSKVQSLKSKVAGARKAQSARRGPPGGAAEKSFRNL